MISFIARYEKNDVASPLFPTCAVHKSSHPPAKLSSTSLSSVGHIDSSLFTSDKISAVVLFGVGEFRGVSDICCRSSSLVCNRVSSSVLVETAISDGRRGKLVDPFARYLKHLFLHVWNPRVV